MIKIKKNKNARVVVVALRKRCEEEESKKVPM